MSNANAPRPRRVLVVDDSSTARLLLERILDTDPALEVVGIARNGREALEKVAELEPDIIVMDVEMPVLDGLQATREIMRATPMPIIVVTASLAAREVDVSLEAERCGAVMSMLKPPGPLSPEFEARAEHLRRMVRLMADVRVARRRDRSAPRAVRTPMPPKTPSLVTIATSTGGPAALHAVLRRLPTDLAVPVLVVQHIAEGFAQGLARWLDAEVDIEVRVAIDGEVPSPGVVYIAPDNGHLEVGPVDGDGAQRLVVLHDGPINGFRPSADRLFASAAEHVGERVLAVILTGMGTDGVRGLEAIHDRGGWIIAQDEATSVIWSMPRAAVQAGIADLELPLGAIGDSVVEIVTGRRRRASRLDRRG